MSFLDQFTGGAAADASKNAANIQALAGQKGIDIQGAATDQARADLAPFANAGKSTIPGLTSLVNDPQAKANFINSNPVFNTAADNAQRRIFANQAARGKLGSGDTAKALQNSLILLGNDLANQNIDQRFRLADVGQNASLGQAAATTNAANNITDLTTGIANAQAAGQIGAANAKAGGAGNILDTGLGLLGLLKGTNLGGILGLGGGTGGGVLGGGLGAGAGAAGAAGGTAGTAAGGAAGAAGPLNSGRLLPPTGGPELGDGSSGIPANATTTALPPAPPVTGTPLPPPPPSIADVGITSGLPPSASIASPTGLFPGSTGTISPPDIGITSGLPPSASISPPSPSFTGLPSNINPGALDTVGNATPPLPPPSSGPGLQNIPTPPISSILPGAPNAAVAAGEDIATGLASGLGDISSGAPAFFAGPSGGTFTSGSALANAAAPAAAAVPAAAAAAPAGIAALAPGSIGAEVGIGGSSGVASSLSGVLGPLGIATAIGGLIHSLQGGTDEFLGHDANGNPTTRGGEQLDANSAFSILQPADGKGIAPDEPNFGVWYKVLSGPHQGQWYDTNLGRYSATKPMSARETIASLANQIATTGTATFNGTSSNSVGFGKGESLSPAERARLLFDNSGGAGDHGR